MQDAIDRAYHKDMEGARAEAIKLYRLGLSIIYEGLSIRAPDAGLGPAGSNVAKWRTQMNTWQQQVLDRSVWGEGEG
jgi:spastin